MLFVFRLLGMLAVALSVGFGLSYYALTDGRLFGAARVGPWAAWPSVGQPEPDPYTRAYLSRTGVLQLGVSEGVRFVAYNDSAGEPLSASCTYRIEGLTSPAAFWTLQATDLEGRNIAASPDLVYLHSDRIPRRNDGTASIAVGSSLASGAWLETAASADGMALVMTLYDVALFASSGNIVSDMPRIAPEACS